MKVLELVLEKKVTRKYEWHLTIEGLSQFLTNKVLAVIITTGLDMSPLRARSVSMLFN